ncbi:MAG: hypothetical protein WCK78_14235 [Paludibacter sp.]
MKLRLIRLLILCILAFNTIGLNAQVFDDIKLDKTDYKAEIGISGGCGYYLGDANNKLFNNLQAANGGFFRYRIDNRIAIKADILGTVVSGDSFSQNSVLTSDLTLEYNFFELEQNPYKRMSKIYSPYLMFGGSFLNYSYVLNPGLTFGLGMKLKLGNRWNINLQWSNRLLFADNLEGNSKYNNTNGLNGFNVFNNDLLSTLTVGISLDVWKKECDCIKAK